MAKLHCFVSRDLSFIFQIWPIPYQVDEDVCVRMLFYLFEPLYTVLEGLLSRDVIGKEDAVCTSVEYSCYWSEGLLACCVPNLQLEYLILDLNDKGTEFHSYGHLMLYFEVIIHYAWQQTTLSHAYKLL